MSLFTSSGRLILASKSQVRAEILRNAGLEIETVPAHLDEAAMLRAMDAETGGTAPDDAAIILAAAKATHVSSRQPGRFVIGADQTLDFEGQIHQKPKDMDEARRRLLAYSGKTHHLHSGVAIARDGAILWEHVDSADMAMRALSPAFVGRYLSACGPSALASVGCYQLEDLGVHLFSEIRGDYFTILGLPLLPLLEVLRREGALDAA